MFVIETPDGFLSDVMPISRYIFSDNIENATKYKKDFWAERVIDLCHLKNARIVGIEDEKNENCKFSF